MRLAIRRLPFKVGHRKFPIFSSLHVCCLAHRDALSVRKICVLSDSGIAHGMSCVIWLVGRQLPPSRLEIVVNRLSDFGAVLAVKAVAAT